MRGVLSFVADDGQTEYKGIVEAIVWEMPGMEFILGLPDIAKNYVQLLTSMLQAEATTVGSMLETDMRQGDINSSYGEIEVSSEELGTCMR